MLVTVWFQFPKLQIFDSTPRWQQAKTCPPSSWCWWGTEALVGSPTTNKLISCVLVVSFLEIQLLFFRKDNFREAPSDWRVWEEIRGNPWSGGEAILQYECQQFCKLLFWKISSIVECRRCTLWSSTPTVVPSGNATDKLNLGFKINNHWMEWVLNWTKRMVPETVATGSTYGTQLVRRSLEAWGMATTSRLFASYLLH